MHKKIFLLFTGLSIFFSNCKKEPSKVQTIIEKDTVYIHDANTIPALINDTITTFIIVRHAEKEDTGADPNLNSEGVSRAEELKRILIDVPINTIYSTPYNRTQQTTQPLANAKGIAITEYSTNKPYAQLVNEMLATNRGKIAVIVGHSNTVPEILKELSNNSFVVKIGESQYDNLFIVNLPYGLSPTITALKYGKKTP